MRPRVTFGVPAYMSEAHIGETIQSILAQEHRDFRVVVAVDSKGDATADICRAFGDSRIEVIEHETNKGWLPNINWLYARCETEFFNYVAHDDVLHPAYLRVLLDLADQRPEAGAIYPIVRRFGTKGTALRHEIIGDKLERQKIQIRFRHWTPFLGMIRLDALRFAAPLREAPHGNTLEDAVFTSRLALFGELAMAPYDLYGKRDHPGQVSNRFMSWDEATRRSAWKNVMGRILDVALLAAETPAQRTELYMLTIRVLASARPEAWTFFNAQKLSDQERIAFAIEFVDQFTQERGLDLENEIDLSMIDPALLR